VIRERDAPFGDYGERRSGERGTGKPSKATATQKLKAKSKTRRR